MKTYTISQARGILKAEGFKPISEFRDQIKIFQIYENSSRKSKPIQFSTTRIQQNTLLMINLNTLKMKNDTLARYDLWDAGVATLFSWLYAS